MKEEYNYSKLKYHKVVLQEMESAFQSHNVNYFIKQNEVWIYKKEKKKTLVKY